MLAIHNSGTSIADTFGTALSVLIVGEVVGFFTHLYRAGTMINVLIREVSLFQGVFMEGSIPLCTYFTVYSPQNKEFKVYVNSRVSEAASRTSSCAKQRKNYGKIG